MKKVKIVLVFLGVICLVYLGAIYYSAGKTQEHFEEKMQTVSAWLTQNVPEIKMTQHLYERGFLSSQSEVKLVFDGSVEVLAARLGCYAENQTNLFKTMFAHEEFLNLAVTHICSALQDNRVKVLDDFLGANKSDPVHYEVVFTSDITNGPWLGGGNGLGLSNISTNMTINGTVMPQEIKEYIESIKIELVRYYSKDYNLHIGAQPFDIQKNEYESSYLYGRSVSKGWDLYISTHDTRKYLDVKLLAPQTVLEIGRQGDGLLSRFTMDGFYLSTNDRPIDGEAKHWMFSGTGDFKVEKITLEFFMDDSYLLGCKDIKWESKANLLNDLFSEDAQFTMTCFAEGLGEPLNMDFNTNISVKNIAVVPLMNIFKEYISIFAPSNLYMDSQKEREIESYLEQELLKFLLVQPELLQHLDLKINGIPFLQVVQDVKIENITAEDKDALVYLVILSKLNAKYNVVLNADILRNGMPGYDHIKIGENRVAASIESGMFTLDGDKLKLDFNFSKGNATLNGQDVRKLLGF